MNLNNNPSEAELGELLKACDDNAGAHILWVDRQGDVIITLLEDITPAEWTQRMDDRIQFRYETYDKGNNYVGPKTSQDHIYVSRLFHHLIRDWQQGARGYTDL